MRKLIASLIAVLVATNMGAQQAVPKLVVCITVEQLRGDYIEYFYQTFGEGGFKRLLKEGLVYNNIEFEFDGLDQASAFASLFTGAYPYYHGISSEKIYDWQADQEVSVLYDKDYLGNYTRDRFSARKLLSSTIGDELKIASAGRSDVYAVAPDAEAAILSAGHTANGVFWIDDATGKWATSTYYNDMPWYADKLNAGVESLSTRIGEMAWTPSLSLDAYKAFPYVMDDIPFKYTFVDNTPDCYPNFKTSALVNTEVNRMALQFVEHAELGTRSCPDMLSITYYAGNYQGNMNKEYTYEIQDTYYQLDRNIAELLNSLDHKIGLRNILVVFTGSGYYMSDEEYSKPLNPGGGEFYPKRCLALLNMYLMTTYGQKKWVQGYYNNQIFLNRKLIEDEKQSLEEMQNKAAEFISQFSGVQYVLTDLELRASNWNENTSKYKYGIHQQGRGDLVIELQPGWVLNNEIPEEKVKTVRNNAVLTPLIFLGENIPPQKIYREVKATEIAPTITHVLRIRPPNACRQQPLRELSKINEEKIN